MSDIKTSSKKDYKDYISEYEKIINKNHSEWGHDEWTFDYPEYAMTHKIEEYYKSGKIKKNHDNGTVEDITPGMPIDKFFEICERFGFKIVYRKEHDRQSKYDKQATKEEEFILVYESKGLILHASTFTIGQNKELNGFDLYGELEQNDTRPNEAYDLGNSTDGVISQIILQECYRNFASQWSVPNFAVSLTNSEEESMIEKKFGNITSENIYDFADFHRREAGKITCNKIRSIDELKNIVSEETLKIKEKDIQR